MHEFFTTESLPMLIAAARRRIKQIAWEQMRPLGVTPQQAGVMLTLTERDGISLTEVALALHLDNPTACRIVNTLSKRGWLETRPDPHDKRRFRLHLTASGKRLGKQVLEGSRHLKSVLERQLKAHETAQLRGLLLKLVARLEDRELPAAAQAQRKTPRPARPKSHAKRGA
jgi:DNA-binding MarR family transcriptional regulator